MKLLAAFLVIFLVGCGLIRGQAVQSALHPPVPEALSRARLVRPDGRELRLEDYRGKVLLLNIWATWCGPCREDIADLVVLHNRHAGSGLAVVGLNVGDGAGERESAGALRLFERRLKMVYDLVEPVDQVGFMKEFNSLTRQQVVPQSILIGRDGRLREIFIGGGSRVRGVRASAVEKVLAENR